MKDEFAKAHPAPPDLKQELERARQTTACAPVLMTDADLHERIVASLPTQRTGDGFPLCE